MKDHYAWGGMLSAPREYPMQILEGYLVSDEFSFDLKCGVISPGWSNGAGIMAGSSKKELPDSLVLLWLSFAEQKFYRGEFELPREKILHYMRDGFLVESWGELVKQTYNTFVVGLAPEGQVAVWLSNGTVQVEVARFQAREETELDPQFVPKDDQYIFNPDYIPSVMRNERVMQPEVKERIAAHGYPPPAVYDAYARRYPWVPEIRFPAGSKITSFLCNMSNGERELWFSDNIPTKDRGIPYLFFINWDDTVSEGFYTNVVFTQDESYWEKFYESGYKYLPLDFAESEIRHVFETKINPEVPFKLVVDIRPSEEKIYLNIEQGDSVYHIKQRVCSAEIK